MSTPRRAPAGTTAEAGDGIAVSDIRITYIGGPTALIEIGPWRLLTDPTFDPPGKRYFFGWGTVSRKLQGPAVAFDQLVCQPAQSLALRDQACSRAHQLQIGGVDIIHFVRLRRDNLDTLQLTEEPRFDGKAGSEQGDPPKLPRLNFVLDLLDQIHHRQRRKVD